MTAKEWIDKLGLLPHPEGGYFKEVYRSGDIINSISLPDRYSTERCFGTSIYFLLEENQFSTFHKLKSDETWHFYDGSSITIYMIDENGNFATQVLGRDVDKNQSLQYTIMKNTWFAAKPDNENNFSLVGCSVYPGFDFADFEMADRSSLTEKFPQHEKLINKFTKG